MHCKKIFVGPLKQRKFFATKIFSPKIFLHETSRFTVWHILVHENVITFALSWASSVYSSSGISGMFHPRESINKLFNCSISQSLIYSRLSTELLYRHFPFTILGLHVSSHDTQSLIYSVMFAYNYDEVKTCHSHTPKNVPWSKLMPGTVRSIWAAAVCLLSG